MKIINDLSKIEEAYSLVIGNFDGVHLGHQSILNEFTQKSKDQSLKTCLLTFNPHPAFVTQENCKNYLIQSYQEKKEAIEKLAIDYYFELPFTKIIASESGESFFEKYILISENLKAIFPGHDFCLGSNREFDRECLKELSKKNGFDVIELGVYTSEEKRISSTLIREFLKKGEIEKANDLLGANFKMTGEVVHGLKNGRKINFPTINTKISEDKVIPAMGVYKTVVTYNGAVYEALTNIGNRPTVGILSSSIETYLINFDQEIYGEQVEVEFLEFIRNEKKFSSFDDLKKQIKKDLVKAWGIDD